MRAYKTLDQMDAIRGALRSFDLLGHLPLREPMIPCDERLHDLAAIADDWDAVAEDLHRAVQTTLADQEVREALATLSYDEVLQQLTKLRTRFEELAETARREYEQIEDRQLNLFRPKVDGER